MDTSLLNLDDLWAILDYQALAYFVLTLVILALAKWLNDRFIPYDLNAQLTTHDNRAIALSFAGYLIGVALIIAGVMSSPSSFFDVEDPLVFLGKDLLNTFIWSLVGVLLLLVSRVVNNRLLLPKFDNVKELETDGNVGVGAVQAGTYIGTGLVISGSLYGEDSGSFLLSLGLALGYFILSQLFFILFGWIYEKMSLYNLHEELEKDNAAAGVAFGMSLIALGILISRYLYAYDSIIGLLVWLVIGALLLIVSRFIVDKFFLPGDLLDEEIRKDRNWGAALIEGVLAIGLALVLTATFLG